MESVFLELTRKCNLKCIFCSNESSDSVEQELSCEEVFGILQQLAGVGVTDLRLYGGEPFLFPQVFNVVTEARKFGMVISIYSNGTIISEEIIKKLQSHKIRKLFLSVDSFDESHHDQIRGVTGSFQTVINNVRTFVAAGIKVDILLTICSINQHDIIETYRFLHSLGVNDIKANFVTKIGKARMNWDKLALKGVEMKECAITINKIHTELFDRSPVRKKCQAGTKEIFIASNGDVFPCALFIDPEYRAGNIMQRDIKDIWAKPEGKLIDIRKIVENDEFCPDCSKRNICGGGCRARAVMMHDGDLQASDITSCIFHKEVLK